MKQDQRIDDIRAHIDGYPRLLGSAADEHLNMMTHLLSIIDTLTREQRERELALIEFVKPRVGDDLMSMTAQEALDAFNASQAKDKADE